MIYCIRVSASIESPRLIGGTLAFVLSSTTPSFYLCSSLDLSKYVVLLVKQDYVGFPDFVWWQAQDANSSVLGLVPLKLIVVPDQPKPNVAGHNLILLILKDKKKTIKQHQATKG